MENKAKDFEKNAKLFSVLIVWFFEEIWLEIIIGKKRRVRGCTNKVRRRRESADSQAEMEEGSVGGVRLCT